MNNISTIIEHTDSGLWDWRIILITIVLIIIFVLGFGQEAVVGYHIWK